MVIEITKENRHLLRDDAGIIFCGKIHEMPDVVRRVAAGDPRTGGVALFERVRLTDGREMFAMVEYDIIGYMPGFGETAIIGIILSDTKMPDEFLDKINYYKQKYKEGTTVWYEEKKD